MSTAPGSVPTTPQPASKKAQPQRRVQHGHSSKPASTTSTAAPRYTQSISAIPPGIRRPPSPTFSTRSAGTNISNATRASRMEWGQACKGPDTIITRMDMRNSMETYERLLATAKAYRNAMLSLANATSNFASALEDCARQKGAQQSPRSSTASYPTVASALHAEDDEDAQPLSGSAYGQAGLDNLDQTDEDDVAAPGEQLMAASALHHIMSNQQQLLCDTFYKSFEIPLLEKFDQYKHEVQDRSLQYEKDTEEKSKRIRDTEAENMRHGRKKQRDLASFRRALQELQSQVDDLDRVKANYYHEVLAGEQETWDMVSNKVSLVVRAEIDSADRIVTKASSDTMIESMIQNILDPFNVYGTQKDSEEGRIFSVLTPLSLSSPASGSPNHPSQGLARARTGLSSNGSVPNGADDSPASTARWAEDQKQRRTRSSGRSEGEDERDDGATPRRRDQLSWISEREDDEEAPGQDLTAESARQTGSQDMPRGTALPEDVTSHWA